MFLHEMEQSSLLQAGHISFRRMLRGNRCSVKEEQDDEGEEEDASCCCCCCGGFGVYSSVERERWRECMNREVEKDEARKG